MELNFNRLIKNQQEIDCLNAIAIFLSMESERVSNVPTLDAMIHAGNSIIYTGWTACNIAKHAACHILFSGGIGHSTHFLVQQVIGEYPKIKTDKKSEAEIFFHIAKNIWKYPEEKIWIETHSKNCGENAAFSFLLLNKKESPFHTIMLVQDPTMLLRTYLTFQKVWNDNQVDVNFS